MKKDDLSVDDYLAKITILANELRDLGVIVDNGELFLISPNDLNASYDAFINSQTARTDEDCFTSFSHLLCEYDAQSNTRPSEHQFIVFTNYVRESRANNSTITCQICTTLGHSTLACYNRHNEQKFPTINE